MSQLTVWSVEKQAWIPLGAPQTPNYPTAPYLDEDYPPYFLGPTVVSGVDEWMAEDDDTGLYRAFDIDDELMSQDDETWINRVLQL